MDETQDSAEVGKVTAHLREKEVIKPGEAFSARRDRHYNERYDILLTKKMFAQLDGCRVTVYDGRAAITGICRDTERNDYKGDRIFEIRFGKWHKGNSANIMFTFTDVGTISFHRDHTPASVHLQAY